MTYTHQLYSKNSKPSRPFAIAEGLSVTLIWASSLIFIKMGLGYIGPLTMAGLRYCLAFLCLLPFMFRNGKSLDFPSSMWTRLIIMGLSAYTIGNGAIFWGLKFVSPTTVSFLLSLSPIFIIFAGSLWLKELPSQFQIAGTVLCLIGSWLFFQPGMKEGETIGIIIEAAGIISFGIFGIIGREVAREQQIDTISLTAIPLAFGGGILLLIALLIEGLPKLTTTSLLIVAWLATVNTAFAYILYNHSLKVLTALEMNVLFNLMPLFTALLSWLFLDERLITIQIIGMLTVISGVIFVQAGKKTDATERGKI